VQARILHAQRLKKLDSSLSNLLPSAKEPQRRGVPLPPAKRQRRGSSAGGTSLPTGLMLADKLAQVVVEHTDMSSYASELSTQGHTAWSRAFGDSLAQRFEVGSLRSALNVIDRLQTWISENVPESHKRGWLQPTAVEMRAFFTDAALRGKTAAKGLFHALTWCQRHLGLYLIPLDSPLVLQFAQATPGHYTEQQDALPMLVWSQLLLHAADASRPSRRICALLVIRVIVSGLRYAHAMRARRVRRDSDERMEVWYIDKGKTAARAPFKVCTPTYIALDYPALWNLTEEITKTFGHEVSDYMIPDIVLTWSDEVGPFELLPVPMPYHRFQGILRQLASANSKVPSETVMKLTSYSARRFLPSVADGISLSLEQRNTLGNWVDKVSGGSEKQSREPMVVRYSQNRLHSAADVKRLCLAALAHCLKHRPEATFADLGACAKYLKKFAHICDDGRWGAKAITNTLPPPELPTNEDDEELQSSDTDSPASSTASSENEDCPLLRGAETVRWASPNTSGVIVHIIREQEDDQCVTPICRRSGFVNNVMTGHGAAEARGAGERWCTTCRLRYGVHLPALTPADG
jgi:hypothetical protein